MTATLRLWEATDAIEIVRDWLSEHDAEMRENEGALPDELAELLSHVEGSFNDKAERVALFIREMLANGKAIKDEEERLRDRRKSFENAADRLKRYLEANMLQAEKMRIDGKLVTLRIQLNNPSVRCDLDEAEIEALYGRSGLLVRKIPESFVLDKKVALEMYKMGEALPAGIEVERGASLRIV